jgi:malonyl-CoA O-methyltransferase
MSSSENTNVLRLSDVIRRFDQAAAGFANSDFVHRQAFDGLLERMRPMQLKSERILDLGCAAGAGSRQLAKSWRRNHVISLDISSAMLQQARQSKSQLMRISEVRADATQLPFVSGSMDLVVANMLLPWIGDLAGFFNEVARVLRVDGLFLYTTLGAGSLSELRQAWRAIDEDVHVHPFVDMHNIADAALRAGLRNPIVDFDPLVVSYRDLTSLFRDLTSAGARNCQQARFNGLTGKQRFASLRRELQSRFVDGALRIELELVYGHAWGGGPVQPVGEFRLKPSQIGRRRR